MGQFKLDQDSNLKLWSWVVGISCFICFLFFRIPGSYVWDDLTYLMNIHDSRYSFFILGRPGFTLLFGLLWYFAKNLGLNFYSFEVFIQICNIAFLSLTYVYIFKLLNFFQAQIGTALLAIALLLSELSFTAISSRVIDSQLMYLMTAASYYYFLKSHENSNAKLLYTSAACAAYAFLAREPGAFFWILFFPFYLFFRKQKMSFPTKNYLTFLALLILLSLSGPLYLYIMYREGYLKDISHSLTTTDYLRPIGFSNVVRIVFESQINLFTFPISIFGFYFLLKKHGTKWITGFLAVCLIPVLITVAILEDEALYESRFYFGLFIALAFFQAHLIEALFYKFKSRLKLAVGLCASVFFLTAYFSFTRSLDKYNFEKSETARLNFYYENLKPFLQNDVVTILGFESQYVKLRSKIDKLKVKVIMPGISWPKDRLVEELDAHLKNGKTVIYDSNTRRYLSSRRESDLKKMTDRFTLENLDGGFVKVKLPE